LLEGVLVLPVEVPLGDSDDRLLTPVGQGGEAADQLAEVVGIRIVV